MVSALTTDSGSRFHFGGNRQSRHLAVHTVVPGFHHQVPVWYSVECFREIEDCYVHLGLVAVLPQKIMQCSDQLRLAGVPWPEAMLEMSVVNWHESLSGWTFLLHVQQNESQIHRFEYFHFTHSWVNWKWGPLIWYIALDGWLIIVAYVTFVSVLLKNLVYKFGIYLLITGTCNY